MSIFQFAVVPLCLLFGCRALFQFWRNRQRLLTLLWAILWLGAAVAITLPESVAMIALTMGIGRGADLVTYMGLLGGLKACIYFYNHCRTLETALTVLVRELAIREAQRGAS